MRIAVWHNLPSGGGKRALYDHVRMLLRRGHEVESWCPPTADEHYLPLADLVPEHIVPLDWKRAAESRSLVRRLSAAYRNTTIRAEEMAVHCRECAAAIDRGRFDVLLSGSCQFSGVAPIARFAKTTKVLYLGEPNRRLYEASPELPWIAPPAIERPRLSFGHLRALLVDLRRVRTLRIQAREEVENARAFDSILVNSLFSVETVRRVYGLDARLCRLGVDADLFVDRGRPRERFVIGVGAFHPHKDIAFVLQALSHLRPPRPRLIWVGNARNRYLDEMQQLASSLSVEFEPRLLVTDTELVDLLNRAVLIAYAPRLEPFGLAPLEANGCGTPVVAVAEGGIRETIVDRENGLLVERDPEAFARAIGRLLDDPEYARRLGRRGRDLVLEHWSLDAAAAALERQLTEAVARARCASTVSRSESLR